MKEQKQHPAAEKLGRASVGCLIVIIPIVILYWIFSPEDSESQQVARSSCSGCVIQSREYIKKFLKSPSSAEFELLPRMYKINDSTCKVVSYVDSQNDLGISKRTDFSIVVMYVPAKNDCEFSDLVFAN